MSLFKTTIELVTGRGAHLFSDETIVLLNGEGVSGLTANDDTKSVFLYPLNTISRQSGNDHYKAPSFRPL